MLQSVKLMLLYNAAQGAFQLAAPTLEWDGNPANPLPVVAITFDVSTTPTLTMTVTWQKDDNSGFTSPESFVSTITNLAPLTIDDFDFGGDWSDGTWYLRAKLSDTGFADSAWSAAAEITISTVPSDVLLTEDGLSYIALESGNGYIQQEAA